jgi:UDP-N-acetylglucosamine 2-epimerase (non-hydrolysing)
VHVVGNTVVDAVEKVMGPAMDAIEKCAGSAAVRDVLPLPRTYAIATLHRAANTDNAERLREWLTAFRDIASQGLSVRLAVHPRLGRRLDEFGLRPLLAHGTGVTVEEPMGYREFLEALAGACVVLTDSGGVQEEACVLQVPCLTLRPHTERPETVEVGANRVVPSGREAVAAALEAMRAPGRQWPNPLGDGHAGERIAGLCCAAVVSAAAPRWALPGR